MKRLWRWLAPLLVAVDQFFNVVLRKPLGWVFASDQFGEPDETISSVLGKELRAGNRRVLWVCRLLHLFDRGHCEKSIEEDEGRA